MDIIILRFPHIAKGVFEQLDYESIKNCREATKAWQDCIDKNKFSWIQVVNLPKIPMNEDTYRTRANKGRS